MGDDHQRRVRRLPPREQKVDDGAAGDGVEIAGRLVGEDDCRPWRHGTGNGDTLLLAAGELRRIMIDAMAKADGAKLFARLYEGVGMAGQLERDGDIFERGHGGQQMEGLEHDADPPAAGLGERILVKSAIIDTADQHLAAAGAFEPRQDRHQRGFARTGCAKDGNALAAHYLEVDALQYVDPRIAGSERQRDIACANSDGIGVNGCVHAEGCSLSSRVNAIAVLLLFVQLYGCSSGTPSNDLATGAQNTIVATSEPPAAAPPPPELKGEAKLVVAFGDSLYAGYNLAPNEGFAPALQRALARRSVKAEVVNAGVSGETTADGLRRLAFTLDGQKSRPDLVILGLGANDMLRGLEPAVARANLDAMLSELKKRGIDAMLTGMMASRNLGPDYAAQFDSIYPDLAKKYGVPLYPFFLDGVVGHRDLLLPDQMHPNAKGIEAIVERVTPVAAGALKD